MKGIELNNDTEKISFFKIIGYSIAKPSKYKKLSEFGLKKAILYLLILIIIVSLVFTISTMFTLNRGLDNGTITLKENEQRPSNAYFFSAYFMNYLLNLILISFIYWLVIALVGWFLSKSMKISLKFKEVLSMSAYAFTVPSIIYIIYAILNYFIFVSFNIISSIYIIVLYMYLFIALLLIKKEVNKSEQV